MPALLDRWGQACVPTEESMHVHIHVMTHAIPNTLGIAVSAVVVLTVNKVVFVVNGFV